MSAERIYWDSDCFLAYLKAEVGKVDLAAATLERAKAGEVVIFTSALTVAEVLWMRGEAMIGMDKAAMVRRMFRHSYFRVRNVTRSVAEAAQELVWNQSIRPKDAVHVATALEVPVPTLETFDASLIAKSGKIGTSTLVIRKPLPPLQGNFSGIQ